MVSAPAQAPGLLPPWSRELPNTPFPVGAGTTGSVVLTLSPAAHGALLAFAGLANVASYTITGMGSGAVLASGTAAPATGYLAIPTSPAIDTSIQVTVTAAGTGPVTVFAAEYYSTVGTESLMVNKGNTNSNEYVFNSTTGLWVPAYSASADALTIGNVPLAIMGVFSSSGGRSARVSSPNQLGFSASGSLDSLPGVMPYAYNNATMDALFNNWTSTVFASAARTTSTLSGNLINPNARGAVLYVSVTAVSGTTPTLSFAVQVVDPLTIASAPLGAATTNITATGNYIIVVYPTAVAGLNGQLNVPLPRNWNVNAVIGGTTPSFTFSVSASYVL